jgi:monovalent cation:H+ antiporter-2, CPA2 family
MQLAGSALLIGAVLIGLGNSWNAALALGLALALSSTALVLRIADPRTPVGRAALAMLLLEDIALVPIVFLLGAMGNAGLAQDRGVLAQTLVLGTFAVLALLVFGRILLPRVFALAARTKSPELFLAASLLAVIAASLATQAAGLSPIVGALIAGLIIAETEYHGEVETMTAPFKGLALGIFLLTVGMSVDLGFVRENLGALSLAVLLVLAAKALVTGLMLRMTGARAGTAAETGILMSSPSETTLIVLAAAVSAKLINPQAAQFWQVVTATGLTVTPLLALAGKRLARRFEGAGQEPEIEFDHAKPHAVIVGIGRVGKMVADMLTAHGQPYIAIDGDADLVAEARRNGYHARFGDAAQMGALVRLGIDRANAAILTMDEPVAAQRLVKRLRTQFPDLPIVARSRDTAHAAQLYRAGASHAVPETLEASLQLSEAVLVELGVAAGPVIASIHEKRDELRQQIMDEGELDERPKLKSTALRDRSV